LVALPIFLQIPVDSDDGENLFGMSSQEISNCVGAFYDEGAILCACTSLKEEFTYARPL
jgi:hypothetical protein